MRSLQQNRAGLPTVVNRTRRKPAFGGQPFGGIVEIDKYVTPEHIDVLSGKRLRFTPPRVFNDPFESSPVLNFDIGPEEWRRNGGLGQVQRSVLRGDVRCGD